MKTETIKHIEEQVNQVTEALKGFVPHRHKEERYGQESEYTAQSLKTDINAILTDIRGLVETPRKFVRLSTHTERSQIDTYLQNMFSFLNSKDYSNAAHHLEELKGFIRSYNVRGSSESEEVLKERFAQINSKYTVAEEDIDKLERIRETAEQQAQQLQSIKEQLESLGNTVSEIEGLEKRSRNSDQEIQSAQASVENQKEYISSFFQQIAERENQLTEQKQFTDEYEKKLESFEKEHEEKRKEAKELIEEARAALELTTAAGVSAAFTARYNEE